MNKKTIGYIVAALVIGAMVVMMVKTKLDKPEPIVLSADDQAAIEAMDSLPGLKKGEVPPDFELTTLEGETVRLSEMKGTKVVLNFWGSWCPPCKAEMPHMQKYYKKSADKDNVEILAVNLTSGEKKGLPAVEQFVEAYGLTFPIPLDKTGALLQQYQVMIIPTTYFIGTDGVIAHRHVGALDEKMLKGIIQGMN
ncbi:TlpA disulfide reductase family protein [Sporosarcina sp. FSL W7-1349]|uniref:peroxiredoxin family protein n=1 Tax=Sporosarcina sp. FSL W7-1349 TaxID=2921561 RepID=UPI0030FCD45B